MKPPISTLDLAKRTGLTRQHVHRLALAGKIPVTSRKRDGAAFRFTDGKEIAQWVKERKPKQKKTTKRKRGFVSGGYADKRVKRFKKALISGKSLSENDLEIYEMTAKLLHRFIYAKTFGLPFSNTAVDAMSFLKVMCKAVPHGDYDIQKSNYLAGACSYIGERVESIRSASKVKRP